MLPVTVLAFVFIPISVSSSIFGMNVQEINDTGHPIWTFVVTAVVLLAFSGLAWLWRHRLSSLSKHVFQICSYLLDSFVRSIQPHGSRAEARALARAQAREIDEGRNLHESYQLAFPWPQTSNPSQDATQPRIDNNCTIVASIRKSRTASELQPMHSLTHRSTCNRRNTLRQHHQRNDESGINVEALRSQIKGKPSPSGVIRTPGQAPHNGENVEHGLNRCKAPEHEDGNGADDSRDTEIQRYVVAVDQPTLRDGAEEGEDVVECEG